jgi:peptide deformylase
MKFEILTEDNPLLREISTPITEFTEVLRGLSFAMFVAMSARNGRGLAAVQVGHPIRLILFRLEEGVTIAMANPRIIRTLNRDEVRKEGCLSIPPFKWKPVARPAKCEIAWQNLEGEEQTRGFTGMDARAVLHEIDHLEGILLTDKSTARMA